MSVTDELIITARERFFSWTSDQNQDGTPEYLAYSTSLWLPDIDLPAGGDRKAVIEPYPTLDGESLVVMQQRAGRHDQRTPGLFKLTWSVVEQDLYRVAQEDHAAGQLVEVRLDHHWRQLRVTPNAAGTSLTVEAGWLDYRGDTYWRMADVAVTITETDRYLYAVPASGTLTYAAAAAGYPAGSVLLASWTAHPCRAADLTLHTGTGNEAGPENRRRCRVVGFEPDPKGGGLVGLTLTLQEQRFVHAAHSV